MPNFINTCCPICTESMLFCFKAKVLGKYDAEYLNCESCGFLRAVNPHWLEEAYASPIADADTGILARNISIAFKLIAVLLLLLKASPNKVFLEAAGGYGILTRLMRDFGWNFYWHDKYCQNLFASGFDFLDSSPGICHSITAVEVLEHLEHPIEWIEEMMQLSGASNFIFTTEIFSGEAPDPQKWWYYMFETGQHISFYQPKTLAIIASKLGLYFYSSKGIHVFSKKKLNKFIFWCVTHRLFCALVTLSSRIFIPSRTGLDHKKLLENASGVSK